MTQRLVAAFARKLPLSWVQTASHLRWKYATLDRLAHWCADRFRNRDGCIQRGVGKGLRFNPGRANAGYVLGTSEPDVQRAMARLVQPGMTVFDIGANVGFHSLIAARLTGPTGRVICFEPLPENAERIKYNAGLNGFAWIEVRQEALAARDGPATFLVSADPTWGKLRSAQATVDRQIGQITVAVRTLDRLYGDGLPQPDLIKIDVEGGEVDVLAGGRNLLREARPVMMIELHGTNAAVARELRALGYGGFVLGSDRGIEQSRWDAFVVAAPLEIRDAVEMARTVSQPVVC